MTDILSLEIMDGPMDGLNVTLSEHKTPISIGRQVGNAMTLAVDMTVSRWHAQVTREGPSWCMIDQNSSYGIMTPNGRESKLLLADGQIILIGSSIVEVRSRTTPAKDILVDEDCFRDPRDIYRMSPKMEQIWEASLQQSKHRNYLDISQFFTVFLKQAYPDKSYRCIREIESADNWKCFGSWLERVRIPQHYKINPSTEILISPRLWKVLHLASDKRRWEIDLENMLQAIVNEKRNLPARYIAADAQFRNDFKLDVTGIPRLHSSHESPKGNTPAEKYSYEKEPDVNKTSMFKAGTEMTLDNSAHDTKRMSLLLKHIGNFEKIILGFLEDAVHLGMPGQNFSLPGAQHRIETLWQAPDGDNEIDHYLNRLENYLIGLLAAHRNAPKVFEKEIGKRINEILDRSNKESKGSFLLKRSNDDLSESIRTLLKNVELEGLSDLIIRNNIKNIIK